MMTSTSRVQQSERSRKSETGALETASLTRLRVSRNDLMLLHEVAVKANETADSARGAVAFAIERMCQTQGWDAGHAFLLRTHPSPQLQPAPSLWRCSRPEGFRRFRQLTRASRFKIGEGMIGTTARTRRPRWVEHAAHCSPPLRFGDYAGEVRSGLVLPVVVRWEPTAVAVLEFYSARYRRQSAGRLWLASGVGALLGRLFEREIAERQLAESREVEQMRIGRELHDTVSQELAGLTMMAERLSEQLKQTHSPLDEKVETLAQHLARVRSKVHALSRGLLPVEIDAQELRAALNHLAKSTGQMYDVDCRVHWDDRAEVVDKVVANHLVRIVQESIQNAVKHGKATTIDVNVSKRGQAITLTVTDDGVGFSQAKSRSGVGLRLMRYRAAAIGAELNVVSRIGHGTRVRCDLRV